MRQSNLDFATKKKETKAILKKALRLKLSKRLHVTPTNQV